MKVLLKNGKNLELKEADYEKSVNLNVALSLCQIILGGWRLPTIEEFDMIYNELHKNGQGNFMEESYWAALIENIPCSFNFKVGFPHTGYNMIDSYHQFEFKVRLVRDL
jgi:hypothetical protein